VEHNLHGLDIDKRAYQLAYFAVMMKGRGYNRRFFRGRDEDKPMPKVYAIMESNEIDKNHLQFFGKSLDESERNKANEQMEYLLHTFVDAREYGSILNVEECDWELLKKFVDDLDVAGQYSFESVGSEETQEKLRELVQIARLLGQKYEAVVTNPPYMGISGGNAKLNDYVKKNYPDSKSDMFAVFIEKCGDMARRNGFQAMITQHAWMFLSSFEKLREKLQTKDIVNMAHLGARAFEEIGGEVVQTTSWVMKKSYVGGYKGIYCRLIEPTTQQGKEEIYLAGEKRYIAQQDNFSKIPGSPVAYWATENFFNTFLAPAVRDFGETREGITTANNDLFLKLWFEISYKDIEFNCKSQEQSEQSEIKWYPHHKGGAYRKWYGNCEYVINWKNGGQEIQNYADSTAGRIRSHNYNLEYIFKEYATWSRISSESVGLRYSSNGFTFDSASAGLFLPTSYLKYAMGFICSAVAKPMLQMLNPTIKIQPGDIADLPLILDDKWVGKVTELVNDNITNSKEEWDGYETSWDFTRHPLLPCAEGKGITTLAGLKIGEKQWVKALRGGSACFNPVQLYITKGENGNNEQGDKFEGVFARLKNTNPIIEQMRCRLREDLETIQDGEYTLLRRKSCKSVLIFCMYGLYKEDAKELEAIHLENGKYQYKLEFTPSSKMYDEFLNKNLSQEESKDTWTMFCSLGDLQKNIQYELDEMRLQYRAEKIQYDIFDGDEFFIEPTDDYPELGHKAKKFSYQKEVRWTLYNLHQFDAKIVKYKPLDAESVGVHEGAARFVIGVEGKVKQNVSIEACYYRWENECNNRFNQLKANEEELNRIFIDIYGLQDELTPEVEDKDVTVRKADLGRDIRSFISYAVGCMFGRYSLAKDGLMFAGGQMTDIYQYHSGTLEGDSAPDGRFPLDGQSYYYLEGDDYLIDGDNIIPITDEEYFEDDIVGRFVEFVKTVYGEDTLEQNLDFIANALGNKGATSREVIRNYFLKDFYKDHVKTYQKRPIYWLFDSGKQNGFKALIYMHRYDADTVGRVRTDYGGADKKLDSQWAPKGAKSTCIHRRKLMLH
jgi:hypothetical protein